MALLINHAILHIINNAGAHYSAQELDIDSETCHEFIQRHVRRLMNNAAAREACFSAESEVYAMVKAFQKGETRFHDFSVSLCKRLNEIIRRGKDIPPADVLVTTFTNRGADYIALLKLNYTECFTHRVVEDDSGNEHQIVKNTAVLPFSGGKVEEACLIPYDPMVLRILEKPYVVDGEEVSYFSQLFLQCETEISRKETAELIESIAADINNKYFDDDIETSARIRTAVLDEAEQSGEEQTFTLDNVVRRAFPERAAETPDGSPNPEQQKMEQARGEFLELAKEAGLPHEVKLTAPLARQQFGTQRLKADNGIEIKCPAELFQDPDTVQVVSNPDGTLTITLKNLRRV